MEQTEGQQLPNLNLAPGPVEYELHTPVKTGTIKGICICFSIKMVFSFNFNKPVAGRLFGPSSRAMGFLRSLVSFAYCEPTEALIYLLPLLTKHKG